MQTAENVERGERSTASHRDARGRTRTEARTNLHFGGSCLGPIRPRQPACAAGRPSTHCRASVPL